MEKESILKDRTIVGSPLTHLFSLGILMFVFWLALSGDFAVKFVVYGLITSAVVAWICYPLLLLPNADGTKKYFALGVSPIAFLCLQREGETENYRFLGFLVRTVPHGKSQHGETLQ